MGAVAKMFRFLGDTVEEVARKLVDNGYPPETAVRMADGTLPMDYASRMQRAREQGFRNPAMYHGTGSDISEIDPAKLQARDAGVLGHGLYSTQAPAIANQYARLAGRIGGENPNVIPLLSRKGSYAQYNLADKGDLAVELAKDQSFSKNLTDQLKSEGYIGADVRDASGGIVERVNFDPNDVRSLLSAAFDPQYKGSSLLGGSAGLGVLGEVMRQLEEKKKRGME